MTSADDQEMARLYVDCGKSIRAIANQYGVSYWSVQKRLEAQGVPFRPRGATGATTIEKIKQAIANDGHPMRTILVALRDNGAMYKLQIKNVTGVGDVYRYLDVLKANQMVCNSARLPHGGRVYVRLTSFGRGVLARAEKGG